jgi:hypothetical protein
VATLYDHSKLRDRAVIGTQPLCNSGLPRDRQAAHLTRIGELRPFRRTVEAAFVPNGIVYAHLVVYFCYVKGGGQLQPI